MNFKFKPEKILEPDTLLVKKGALSLVNSFKRVSEISPDRKLIVKTHRVFEDSEGRKYIEIFNDVKLQKFIAELLKPFLVSPVYSYELSEGERVSLSMCPLETDFDYAISGRLQGMAKIILLEAIFSDNDHSIESGVGDSGFEEKQKQNRRVSGLAHNLNIFLGNFVPFDFGNSSSLSLENIDSDIDRSIYNLKTDLEFVIMDSPVLSKMSLNEKDKFWMEIMIYLEEMCRNLEKHLGTLGEQGLKDIAKKSYFRSVSTIFPNLPSYYKWKDLLKLFLVKTELLRKRALLEASK